MNMHLAAVVILYNPNESVKANINSYIQYVDKLYVIDNSDTKDTAYPNLFTSEKKIQYIDNGDNKGIAHALNRGFGEALKDHYDYLLAMDQDSGFRPGDFKKLLTSLEDNQRIGIYAPLAFENELELIPVSNKISITSGSIFNLNVYKKVGPFNDDLFIDSVDTEYCLRMDQKGYILKRIPSVTLDHQLGRTTKNRFMFWDFYTTNHSSLRRYYMSRNRFYLWKKFKTDYPGFVHFDKISTFKELIKVILVEDNKLDKIKMTIKGYLDYKKNRYGKYLKGDQRE